MVKYEELKQSGANISVRLGPLTKFVLLLRIPPSAPIDNLTIPSVGVLLSFKARQIDFNAACRITVLQQKTR